MRKFIVFCPREENCSENAYGVCSTLWRKESNVAAASADNIEQQQTEENVKTSDGFELIKTNDKTSKALPETKNKQIIVGNLGHNKSFYLSRTFKF